MDQDDSVIVLPFYFYFFTVLYSCHSNFKNGLKFIQ